MNMPTLSKFLQIYLVEVTGQIWLVQSVDVGQPIQTIAHQKEELVG